MGHPGHLGCLCQFEPLWPKKSFQHSPQNSADNFFGTQCVYDISMKLRARAGLVYLEVNGGHFWERWGGNGFHTSGQDRDFPQCLTQQAKKPCVMFFCN